MSVSSWSEDGNLKLKTELLCRTSRNSDKEVRMVWEVENKSGCKIRIQSYYCPFYIGSRMKGVYIRGNWVKERFEIANDHVRTYLYPEEMRTYVWDWVGVSYYGLKGVGPWHYRLEFYYFVEGDPTRKKIIAQSNSIRDIDIDVPDIRPPDKLGPFTSHGVIGPLLKAFPTIDDFRERDKVESELVPSGRAAVVPDAVLRTDKELVVIQMVSYVSRADLVRLEQVIEKLANWANNLGLSKVVGAFMAIDPDSHIESLVEREYPNIRVLKIKSEVSPSWLHEYLTESKIRVIDWGKNRLADYDDVPAKPGVYALYWGTTLQYIGYTARSLRERLYERDNELISKTDVRIPFGSFAWFVISKDQVKRAEALLIGKWGPLYNVDHPAL